MRCFSTIRTRWMMPFRGVSEPAWPVGGEGSSTRDAAAFSPQRDRYPHRLSRTYSLSPVRCARGETDHRSRLLIWDTRIRRDWRPSLTGYLRCYARPMERAFLDDRRDGTSSRRLLLLRAAVRTRRMFRRHRWRSPGFFTFGSHHAVPKLNDRLFGVWHEIVSSVPHSHYYSSGVPSGPK